MRIGITSHDTVGGSGAIATALGKLLANEGHEVHFVCHNIPFGLASSHHPRITIHEVEVRKYPPLKYPPYGMALAVKMAAVAKLARLDLLHVHYAIPHALSAYLAREMLAPVRLRTVCTLHGTDITLVGADPSYRPLVKFCIEVSDAVTSVSNWLTETVKQSFGLRKDVKTIHNFISIEEYRRIKAPSKKTPTIVHISNFRPLKRTSDVVKVFERVRDKIPCRLIMVGDGPERAQALALAKDLGVDSDVRFLGITHSVVDILSNANVFLLPSELESFGLAALEAMTCEVPVIATDVGGLSEVVEDGQSGYLLPVGDIESMAAKALDILKNPELQKELGKRGRAIAAEKFSPRTALASYSDVYRSVLR